MKLLRTIIRPEQEEKVLQNLETAGLYAVTKIPVLGRGRQRGVQVGRVSYNSLAKLMILLIVEEGDFEKAVEAIETGADTGHPGDGKIFVQEVLEAYSVRTGMKTGSAK